MSYRIVLPIRYKIKNKKVKKGYSDRIVSYNWFHTLHYTQKNKIKKYYQNLVKEQLKDIVYEKLDKYRISAYLYYDRNNCDANNIYGCLIKFLEDEMIDSGLILDDNLKHGVRYALYVESEDRDNPRIDFVIESIE